VQRHGTEFYYVSRQALCGLFGLALMLVLSRVPYQKLSVIASPLLLLQIILVAMTMLSPLGHEAQGASRWLRLGPLSFQPSEMARFTVALYLARHLSRPASPSLSANLLRFAPVSLLLLFIFRQPDLGTTALLLAVIIGMLFVAGLKLRYFAALVFSGAVFVTLSMLYSPYRMRRLTAFLDPWADPQGSGFQTLQSFISLYSGKVFGVGLGNGSSKLFYLPEVHTDFIFALIGEELGFIGAALTIVAFGALVYLMFKSAAYAKEPFGKYLGIGLALSFAIQIAVNLGGVTGTLPVKGLPLPFLSWGRSALLVNLCLMGVFLNIVRQAQPKTATVLP
jgi:cell division protein FtsW